MLSGHLLPCVPVVQHAVGLSTHLLPRSTGNHFGLCQGERPSGAPLGTNLLAWNTPGAPKPPGRARRPGDHATLELVRTTEGDSPRSTQSTSALYANPISEKLQDADIRRPGKHKDYGSQFLKIHFSALCLLKMHISGLFHGCSLSLFQVILQAPQPGPLAMTPGHGSDSQPKCVFCSFSISAFFLLPT